MEIADAQSAESMASGGRLQRHKTPGESNPLDLTRLMV
jgi:hypothetical protein